jgi:hypothetical protein
MGNTFRKSESINQDNTEHNIDEGDHKSIHESNKQKFKAQIRFKRNLNIIALFILLTQLITLILDYFIGEFIINHDSNSNIFIDITSNIGQTEIYEIDIADWEKNCTAVSPDPFPNSTFEKENFNYTGRYKLCKTKFLIDHTKVDSTHYTECQGYNVVGNRCPWHTAEVRGLIQPDTLVNDLDFNEEQKYVITLRAGAKIDCVTELKNLWFMPMNKYSGTYYIYTMIIVFIILLEISAFIKFNRNYKEYIFEDMDKSDNGNTTMPWLERNIQNEEKVKKYASHKKLMMENLQAIRMLIVLVIIYCSFLVFNFYLQKGSSYSSNFKRLSYLVDYQCFVKPIYNSYIEQFYKENYHEFCVFYYYRVGNNYFSGLCFVMILLFGRMAFTWNELFCTSKAQIKRVFSETDSNFN